MNNKPKASVRLVSEQSPEPVPTHGGLASYTTWTLTIEGVVIDRVSERHLWSRDREKYTTLEFAPRGIKETFDQLCAVFDAPE